MTITNLNRVAWVLLCVVMGFIAVLYLSLGIQASQSTLVMPLDDTYIHFQYARQMAQGEPYIYNPGDEPTSGSTSFLYTPILAIGYLLGFHNLQLSYWAVGLGWLLFLGSAWLIYRLIYASKGPIEWSIAILLMLAFAISGPFAWAAFSGMETLLFVFATLLAFYAYSKRDLRFSAIAGTLAALARPEGAIIALTGVMALDWRKRGGRRWFFLVLIATTVQPIINFLITGTFSASGNQAKSHLYNVVVPFSERLKSVGEFWWRLWREMITGTNPVDGKYIPVLVTIFGLAMVVVSIKESWQKREISPALLAGSWLFSMSIGVATLDTAFWHFKRYQLPLMAVVFPLAGWAVLKLRWQWLKIGLAVGMLVISGLTTFEYARRYRDNVYVVQNQQIAMAEWIDANVPENARIGVHDVGIIRYIGNRATYDMVGLTTPDVALAWRQGSGVLYDTMKSHPNRPDYFAVYHDIQALPLLEQAGVFGEELSRFTVELPGNTVASATNTQIVSRANWHEPFDTPRQRWSLLYLENATLVAQLEVGNLLDEAKFHYHWWNDEPLTGFASTVRNLMYASCDTEPCSGIDGGRVVNGGERFDLPEISSEKQYLVILRVHPESLARLKVGCQQIETVKIVPSRPGTWLEVPMLLPTRVEQFCIEVEGIYHPFAYWIYEIPYTFEPPSSTPEAIFRDPLDGREFQLLNVDFAVRENTIIIDLTWFSEGNLHHDGKLFVHLYEDINQPPIRQIDQWVADDSLPPANWLPGRINEQIEMPLENLPTGKYTLALGFYEPNLQQRYHIIQNGVETDRLFLGEID